MYHHFRGKADLALAAITRSAEEMRTGAEVMFSGPGTPVQRITSYPHRERDALRGCPVGRLTQDPDVMADPALRRPVDEFFAWLRARIAGLVTEAQAKGELDNALDPAATATAIVAVLQGGYVIARAADDADVCGQAVDGALGMLASGH
ncbi:TetR/AcrR family transcriptional regulator [Nonomuraea sp. NPDC046802]|uniref:TetR/AcrR family transcriptional regulator n=1 Tax=Nonomuraea sp. NPDC046802 TaxID=3154919 RepID=UPI0033F9FE29